MRNGAESRARLGGSCDDRRHKRSRVRGAPRLRPKQSAAWTNRTCARGLGNRHARLSQAGEKRSGGASRARRRATIRETAPTVDVTSRRGNSQPETGERSTGERSGSQVAPRRTDVDAHKPDVVLIDIRMPQLGIAATACSARGRTRPSSSCSRPSTLTRVRAPRAARGRRRFPAQRHAASRDRPRDRARHRCREHALDECRPPPHHARRRRPDRGRTPRERPREAR